MAGAIVAACAFVFPSTAGAAERNLVPEINLPIQGPVGDTVNGVTHTVTQTVNTTVNSAVDTVSSAVDDVTGGGNSGSGAPTVPVPDVTVPEVPGVTPEVTVPTPDVTVPDVPDVPGVTSPPSGGGGDASSGNTGSGNTGSGNSGGSSEPTARDSSASPSGGSSTPAERRRERELRKTPEGRRRLRRERAAEERAREAAEATPVADTEPRGGSGTPSEGSPSGDDGGGFGLPRPIERVVEVVPGPIKALLAILLGLTLVFFGRGQVVARRAKRLARERKELLHDVGLLQEALLPESPEQLGELRASVAYRPADGPAAGGDFYDAFLLDDQRVAIIVGDVSGHGRGALARTALMRYTLRAYLDAGLEPRKALKVAGRALDDDLGGDFATVVVAVHDPAHATITYASAGHPPPIVSGSGNFEPVTALSSPPIGTGLPTGQRQTTLHLPGDATACFFTDGLIEARVDGELVGREKLTQLLADLNGSASADGLLAGLAEYATETPDDMAACIVKPDKLGAVDHVPERIEEVELSSLDLTGDSVERFLAACGVSPAAAAAAIKSIEASVGEFGDALLRVRIDAAGARCEVDSETGMHDPLGVRVSAPNALRVL